MKFNGRIVDSRRYIPQEFCASRVDEPMKSTLLEDGHLTLDEIIRLKAEFAFLSACQTMA
ncbi:hypothetical protein CPB86DRAFT_791245 [Serendipita vermifera]|nr:hypothetical protein CPB86DRAFT_791245 [Serendipita vermifera]